MLLPEPGCGEMNLTLGSSWPMYLLLSSKRAGCPCSNPRTSVQNMPASCATAWYLWLQPLQSTWLTGLAGTAPVATDVPVIAAVAAVAAVAAPALPVIVIWQMTARPIAGTSSSRHLRPPPGGDPRPNRAEEPRADQGVRMRQPSRSCVPPRFQAVPLADGHAGVTVSRFETLCRTESNNDRQQPSITC